ncbi:immunoglobulin superfamily member 10-like isoform X2 [Macrobrachium rosenbergii]|uniref:immunoglobulin superfamily member 10-like isoform X2 n=1 Tax=Macrobrachium rosenbergii TaxID=79674 RepID=UPI0034D57A04
MMMMMMMMMTRVPSAICSSIFMFGIVLTAGGGAVLTTTAPPQGTVPQQLSPSPRETSINNDEGAISGISSSTETVVTSFVTPKEGIEAKETATNASEAEQPKNRGKRSSSASSGSHRGRSSSSVVINVGTRHMGMNLSGSSSSPVEPIKPLLELGVGEEGAPLIVPPHPVFDEATPKNVSGLAGNAAYLHCLVHNLANKSVSWIRQRDLHILTVGRYTYTTDERYEVIHAPGSKDWILKIKYAQVRDTGYYECQVSTKPVRTYQVKLNIFAPHAEIIGSPDMHVDKGSTINLTCIIAHSPEPPTYIYWYHNGKVITYDSPRGGITSVTERSNSTTGYLLIQNAQPPDSGNYSCSPSNTAATSLRVHVLNGETPEAVQTNGGGTVRPWAPFITPSLLSCLFSYFCSLLLSVVRNSELHAARNSDGQVVFNCKTQVGRRFESQCARPSSRVQQVTGGSNT